MSSPIRRSGHMSGQSWLRANPEPDPKKKSSSFHSICLPIDTHKGDLELKD